MIRNDYAIDLIKKKTDRVVVSFIQKNISYEKKNIFITSIDLNDY